MSNKQCLHCGRILQAKGFPSHMKTHEGEPQLPGGDWKKTVKNPTPGKRKRNKEQTPIKGTNCYFDNSKCMVCGRVYKNNGSVRSHLKQIHDRNANEGLDWERTDEKPSSSQSGYGLREKYRKDRKEQINEPIHNNHEWDDEDTEEDKPKRKRQSKPQVITPDMQYIDIPIILRVPISLGQVQIKQTE